MTLALYDLLEQTRQQAIDSRTSLADIHIEPDGESVAVRGQVLDRATAERLMRALRAQAPTVNWRDDMQTLVTGPDYHWALLTRPVADLRREPSHRAERVTQALLGEALETLRVQGAWTLVRLSDGYLGWLFTGFDTPPLTLCHAEQAQAYRQQATHLVIHPLAPFYAHPSGEVHDQSGLLPFGVRVPVVGQDGALQRVRWPDGTLRWISSADLLPLAALAPRCHAGLRQVLDWAQRLIGVPYLWGGKTPFGYDCSGLTQTLFGVLGIDLPRDADQQAERGTPVALDALACGDLLFFGDPADAQHQRASRVTHVALALNRHEFLDASRSGGGVAIRSRDPRSPIYAAVTAPTLLFARRYLTRDL